MEEWLSIVKSDDDGSRVSKESVHQFFPRFGSRSRSIRTKSTPEAIAKKKSTIKTVGISPVARLCMPASGRSDFFSTVLAVSFIDLDGRSGINAREVVGTLELCGVEGRVDRQEIDTDFVETRASSVKVWHGNHPKRALFTRIRLVHVALEQSAGKRIGISAHERELHPGIRSEVVMVFQEEIAWFGPVGEVSRGGEDLDSILCFPGGIRKG